MKGILIVAIALCSYLPLAAQQWKLVWFDEFTQPGLPDPQKWDYDIGGNGWGNQEKQIYTRADPKTASVRNGSLFITAYKTPDGQYHSARLVSKARGGWKYARIEIRARLPRGNGVWPTIWMLPIEEEYGDWPDSGEIDILEFAGHTPDSIYTSIHTASYNQSLGTKKTKAHYLPMNWQDFHVFAIEWLENHIYFKIDGKTVYQFRKEKDDETVWPFDQAFQLILNLAVGGTFGGEKGIDDQIFPQSMEIDYIRISQPAAH